eukprot:3076388-Rhodomonas_salina.5
MFLKPWLHSDARPLIRMSPSLSASLAISSKYNCASASSNVKPRHHISSYAMPCRDDAVEDQKEPERTSTTPTRTQPHEELQNSSGRRLGRNGRCLVLEEAAGRSSEELHQRAHKLALLSSDLEHTTQKRSMKATPERAVKVRSRSSWNIHGGKLRAC